MKIDIFSHIFPKRYREAVDEGHPQDLPRRSTLYTIPTLTDLDLRFRLMDKYEDLRQVLTIAGPPVEMIADQKNSAALARLANDEMASILMKHPDRFVTAAACLPMNNMESALAEAERAVKSLGFRGVQIATSINGKPLDSKELMPLYAKMCEYDLPIWIHPVRLDSHPDYLTENRSKYGINVTFGWIYETTAAMARLVFSGIFDRYPKLKIITHHGGAMVPFLAQRIVFGYDMPGSERTRSRLAQTPINYFKMFYCDTAIQGNTSGLMCAHSFFGKEHVLFGTDAPFDNEYGNRSISRTIASIREMSIAEPDKEKIFSGNAIKLLHLSFR
ncbi:MAG: amidohydrolase family protein [Desulfobacterales bacterium]|nr:amidohydrolase family protein [Desulfobacterales bacterium]